MKFRPNSSVINFEIRENLVRSSSKPCRPYFLKPDTKPARWGQERLFFETDRTTKSIASQDVTQWQPGSRQRVTNTHGRPIIVSHGPEVVTRSLPLQESLVLLRNLGLQAREMHYAAVIFRIQQIRSLGWLDWFIWSRYTKGFRYWWTQNKFPWRPLNDSNGRYEALNNYLWQQKKLMGEVVPCQLSRCVGQSIPCRKHGDIR
jgi:hypothetical protein